MKKLEIKSKKSCKMTILRVKENNLIGKTLDSFKIRNMSQYEISINDRKDRVPLK